MVGHKVTPGEFSAEYGAQAETLGEARLLMP